MLKAIDVANFFIYLMPEADNEITNLKLNKLIYFAQGYNIQRHNKPLFKDEIQAWQYGPVVPSVYHEFKGYKNSHIPKPTKNFDIKKYSEEDKELMLDVAREYGKFTGEALRDITHQSNSPWSQVYEPNKKSIKIPISYIQEYFDRLPSIEMKELIFDDDAFIGYRDEEGFLVLPKEYDV